MRRWLLLVAVVLAGCGSGTPGFRIDDVTLTPDDIPVDTPSSTHLKVAASVFNEQHEVTNVWVTSGDGLIWIELTQGAFPRWTGEMPLSALHGFPSGDYFFDFHARDDADRNITLENAVRLRIRVD